MNGRFVLGLKQVFKIITTTPSFRTCQFKHDVNIKYEAWRNLLNRTGILCVVHVPLWRGFRGEVKADFFVNIKYDIFLE